MTKLLRALRQSIAVWWAKDRIRVSRAEGKLFNVVAKDRLILGETLLVVVSRYDQVQAGRQQITFTLAEDECDASDLWYLTYTNYCDGLPSKIEENGMKVELDYSDSPLPRELIILSHNGESFDLLPEQIQAIAG